MHRQRKVTSTLARRTPLLLFLLLGAWGCVSPAPSRVTSPDVELEALLESLRDARGGTYADTGDNSRSSAEREGALQEGLRRLALTHPTHVPTLVANAALAYERRQPIQAQKYLDQALHHDPNHVPATLLRVRIASESGNLPYARRKLSDLIQVVPDSAEVREAYSGVLYLDGDYDGAARELDMVDRLRGDGSMVWRTDYHRGLIAEAQGNYIRAGEFYRRSQELAPGFAPAARRARWLLHREGPSPSGF